MNSFQSIYELIGEDQIRLLTRYFYGEVAKNPALRKLYPEDLAPAERRLFRFSGVRRLTLTKEAIPD